MPIVTSRPLGALSPTQISTFKRCPASWRLRYVDRQPFVDTLSPAAAAGGAAHRVLASLLRQPADTWSNRSSLDAERLVRAQIAATSGLSVSDVEEAIAIGCDAVSGALASLDPAAHVVGVETTYTYRSKALDQFGASLTARLDLVVRHPDGKIEMIDYKTGRPNSEHVLQSAIGRMVLSSAFPAASRGEARIRTTTLYPRTGETVSGVLSLDQVREAWREVLDIAGRMAALVATPQPGPHCRWCPFQGNGCTIPVYLPDGTVDLTCLGQVDPPPSC